MLLGAYEGRIGLDALDLGSDVSTCLDRVRFGFLPDDDKGAYALVRVFSPDIAETKYQFKFAQVPIP